MGFKGFLNYKDFLPSVWEFQNRSPGDVETWRSPGFICCRLKRNVYLFRIYLTEMNWLKKWLDGGHFGSLSIYYVWWFTRSCMVVYKKSTCLALRRAFKSHIQSLDLSQVRLRNKRRNGFAVLVSARQEGDIPVWLLCVHLLCVCLISPILSLIIDGLSVVDRSATGADLSC